jgi:hypothetical protein
VGRHGFTILGDEDSAITSGRGKYFPIVQAQCVGVLGCLKIQRRLTAEKS